MVESKITKGSTNEDLAEEFGVSRRSVEKALSLAAKADLIVSFEDKLVKELLPLAHETAILALKGEAPQGSGKIAMEILKGTQILRPSQPRSTQQAADDDELSKYIAKKRLKAREEELTIDGEFRTEPVGLQAPQRKELTTSLSSADESRSEGSDARSPQSEGSTPETAEITGQSSRFPAQADPSVRIES